MYYMFHQNNSGGDFIIDRAKGIGTSVIIQADSAEEANVKAEAMGIYFDGVDKGIDCECCGDRWMRVTEADKLDVKDVRFNPDYVKVVPLDLS